MESLPAFEKYDVAQFDAWLDAYVASLRERCRGWWEEEYYGNLIARVSERGELIRELLVDGNVVLRPTPPPGKMPRYAMELLRYLDPPPKAPNTEAGKGSHSFSASPVSPAQPEPEITVLCVPTGFPSLGIRYPAQHGSASVPALRSGHTSRSSIDQANQSPPERRRGARRMAPERIERDGRKIEELRDQGFTWAAVAVKMKLGERTCRQRLERLLELRQEGR